MKKHKPSFYQDARWTWNNTGFIYLPHGQTKLVVINDRWQYDFTVGLIEYVNKPGPLTRLWRTIKPPVKGKLGTTAFDLAIRQYQAETEKKAVTEAPKRPRGGHVIKNTKPAEYDPIEYDPTTDRRRGGRVVKAMPRQIQKMKEAQEKVEDE